LNPNQLVDLDLLLTDAFLILSAHLFSGKVNPETVDPQWHVDRRKRDMAQFLETSLTSGQIETALYSLLPTHLGYARLRQALIRYRNIYDNSGWPAVPTGTKLQRGDRGDRVAALRKRLAIEGFIENQGAENGTLFDDALDKAVRKFQRLNGLDTDGIVGTQTLQALNIAAGQRVRQIVVNLERWRWLPQNWGRRYVIVNIASFNLNVVENEQLVMDSRVIAGKTYRRTPVFSDRVTYLVLNPSWEVPKKIARKDLLPKIKKDPQFLSQQKIRIFKGWGSNAREIDPKDIDWKAVKESNFEFRLRQDPGPLNALGRIKFMFPNQFDVYLHDTPARNLFEKSRRDFSSGCIRMEKPVEFAEYLLRSHLAWPPEKIRSSLTGSEPVEQTVQIPEPINIHILYWTVWLGHDDLIHFSPDIYGRDSALDAALQKPPPGSSG
jgi:murein L,D-transpeptidase YcbB/YkuD